MTTVTMVVGAVSTPIISFCYESTGSYLVPWVLCMCFAVVSTLSLLTAARMVGNEKS